MQAQPQADPISASISASISAPWAALVSALLVLLAGCGSRAEAVSGGGMGLVILPADTALRGLSPEELEARGVRSYFHDFGRVQVGETVQHLFQLENTDPAPVTITRMQASCGCTTPTIRYVTATGEEVRGTTAGRAGPVITIPPGTTAELAFRLDTSHSERVTHNTDKVYTVQIQTDSPNRAYMRLEAHIFIERAFQVTPEPLDLGRIPRSGGGRGRIDVLAVGASRATIVGPADLPPGLTVEVVAEAQLWHVNVALEPPLEPGPLRRTFELMTEDEEELPYYPLQLEVRAYVVEDVDWSPERFLVRNAAEAGQPLQAAVEVYSLLSGERLRVTGAHVEGEGTEGLQVAFEPNDADAHGKSIKWTLKLSTPVPFGEAVVRGKVKVELEGREPLSIELVVNPH